MPESILDRLKRETADLHHDVEGLLPLMKPDISLVEYAHFLSVMQAFYAALEPKLQAMPELVGFVEDVPERWKSHLLANDLRSIATTPTGPESARAHVGSVVQPVLPELDDTAAALGCLYVLEGSTLGGSIIARHLKSRLGAAVEPSLSFLTPYGAQVGPRWKAMGASLVQAVDKGQSPERIVAGARRTFESLKRVFVSAALVPPQQEAS